MVVKKLANSTKDLLVHGTKGTIGFVGTGIAANAIQNAVGSHIPNVLGTYQDAAVNFLIKVLGYGIVDKKLGADVAGGLEINAVTGLATRLLSGGAPTLMGYNILSGLPVQNPDAARYGLPTGVQTEKRDTRYGQMDNPRILDPAARNARYGAMPYGAMPFSNPVVNRRQQQYGTMPTIAEMFDMK